MATALRSGPLLVTCRVGETGRAALAEVIGEAGEIVYLADLAPAARAPALRAAAVVLARNTAAELATDELPLLAGIRLLQFLSAGIDFIPLGALPPGVPVASNGGAYAEPMAEHVLAMALAAAKRLLIEHRAVAAGRFNQFGANRMLAGGVCGILGFGGIGVATARLMRAIGMRIHGINRRGASDGTVDWMGTPDQRDTLLGAADVLVISLPLTRGTTGMIGARELALMKPDAILVNVARGEIIDEAALYAHLQAQPAFTACIDAWWIEPVRHGSFRMELPFTDLPNVIASPHNSAQVPGIHDLGLRNAARNCRRVLLGETPRHLVGIEDRMA